MCVMHFELDWKGRADRVVGLSKRDIVGVAATNSDSLYRARLPRKVRCLKYAEKSQSLHQALDPNPTFCKVRYLTS